MSGMFLCSRLWNDRCATLSKNGQRPGGDRRFYVGQRGDVMGAAAYDDLCELINRVNG